MNEQRDPPDRVTVQDGKVVRFERIVEVVENFQVKTVIVRQQRTFSLLKSVNNVLVSRTYGSFDDILQCFNEETQRTIRGFFLLERPTAANLQALDTVRPFDIAFEREKRSKANR